MVLADFSFIADENIDPEVIYFLRSQSIKASSLLELDLIGASDKEIFNQALKSRDIILTQDGDFGSLIHTMNCDYLFETRPLFRITSHRNIKSPDSIGS